ncbi:hypothetical protein J6590_028601 [Homalodisca vitripennis]|nr:hypothetical protein J6590_028601 [Homalodisca vitripennis]
MFRMNFILPTIVITTFTISAAFAVEWGQPHVTFWSYYPIPVSVCNITSNEDGTAEYVFVCHDDDFNLDLYSYPDDPRVILLFDKCGEISGIRTCYIKTDIPKRAESQGVAFNYSYDDKGTFRSYTYWEIDVWCVDTLFASPETLAAGCRSTEVSDLYVVLGNYTFTKLARSESDIENQGFTKQGCLNGMGQHYFYNMYTDTPCEELVGVMVLYDYGELIGVAYSPFGAFTSGHRVWFEEPNVPILKVISPNAPQCLYDWNTYYGISAIHIFMKKNPRETYCPY